MGMHAPAMLLVSFIPILLIAFGYKYLNRADPDCGTTFAWATRAMGPWVGWMNGWAIFLADVIVMASLAVDRRRPTPSSSSAGTAARTRPSRSSSARPSGSA